MRIITITGASGTGKTSLAQAYHDKRKIIPFYRFDSIGIPPTDDMKKQCGSIEEWQRRMTIEWINRIGAQNEDKDWVIFEGQTRPQFINEAYALAGITGAFIICLWCDVPTMKQRLIYQRQDPDLFSGTMLNWSNCLRKWTEECENGTVVDTSGNDTAKNLASLTDMINSIMANEAL